MAAVGNSNLTLTDLASRMEQGSVSRNIIEILSKQHEILDDMVWVEANDGSSHKTTIRTGIPEPTWRQLNYGVSQTKSTTAQVKDACGMLENYSTVDSALVSLAGDKQAFRMTEESPFMQGMANGVSDTLFYGNTTTNPERFMGLGPRFNSLSAENGQNIISGGGANGNTSIWLVVWGEDKVHGLYPKGSQAGLTQKDLGEQTVYDANNNPYQAFRSHYKWDCGLSVRDWRYIVRIANVKVADLTKNAATGADLVDLLTQALELVQDLNGKPAFYCNRTIRGYLRRQMMNRSNLALSMEDIAGKKVLAYDGIPIRRCDSILNTESAVA